MLLLQAVLGWQQPVGSARPCCGCACDVRASRGRAPVMLDAGPGTQIPLPYEVPKQEKPFADYEWDDSFPGTFKPGTRGENQDLAEVLEMWKDRENPACMELPQDQLWQVPLAPPEDILSWLNRIGLLAEEDETLEEEKTRGDSLLEDEFDLDDDAQALGGDDLLAM